MRKMLSVVGVGALIAIGFSGAAAAGTFVWQDKANDFTFSFPDSWTEQTGDVPTTAVRIAGPIAEDFATCRVKAEKDGSIVPDIAKRWTKEAGGKVVIKKKVLKGKS